MLWKSWYKSKAVWGNIVSLLAMLAGIFGVDVAPEDQAMIVETISRIVAGAGVLYAIYGRVTAKHLLSK